MFCSSIGCRIFEYAIVLDTSINARSSSVRRLKAVSMKRMPMPRGRGRQRGWRRSRRGIAARATGGTGRRRWGARRAMSRPGCLASCGQAGPVEPQFTAAARGVRFGGVLAALPALLKEGLLSETGLLPLLPKGYYGLPTILLFLAFMTLARVRNPESLRYQTTGEWGAVLGLDRCPAVKTLRRKIGLMANDEAGVQAWQLDLARRWQQKEPELWATLAVDGHVKVIRRAQGAPAQTLRLAREAVPAGERQLLGQRPGRQAPAVPAQAAGPEDGRRHRS